MKKMDKPHFENAVSGADGWETIDDLLRQCDEAGYWDAEWLQNAEQDKKKHHIRQMIKQLKDDDSFPKWHSVVIKDKLGNDQRVYKQESLFEVEDYQQTIDYHSGIANHHFKIAQKLIERCDKKFGVQLALPIG